MTWLQEPYRPVEIDDVTLVFPGDIEHLMPAPEEIPAPYWDDQARYHPLHKMVQRYVYSGETPENWTFNARPDINYELVARHLGAIQRSFQPKHEHKCSSLLYLFDLWFPGMQPEGEIERPNEVQEGQ